MRREQRERIQQITKSFIILFILGFILYKFQNYIQRKYGVIDNYEDDYEGQYRNNIRQNIITFNAKNYL